MMTKDLSGKTALVIGGTSGIGKATAELLSTLGANVIVASRKKESIDKTVAELLESSGNSSVKGLIVDLTDSKSVEQFIAEIETETQIDFLVNASGIFRPKHPSAPF